MKSLCISMTPTAGGCRMLLRDSKPEFESTTRPLPDSVGAPTAPERAGIERRKTWWRFYTVWDSRLESTWRNCSTPLSLQFSFRRGRIRVISCALIALALAQWFPRHETRRLFETFRFLISKKAFMSLPLSGIRILDVTNVLA